MEGLELVFNVCALLGGALFGIQLLLQLLGFSFDLPSDQVGGIDLSHSDVSFKALSLLGVTAFLMMFGLGGRAMLATLPARPLAAVGVGVVSGFVAIVIIGQMFTWMKRLQSNTLSDPQEAVGREGVVYLGIPENDIGKIRITVNGRLSVLDARSTDGQPIPTGQRVRVQTVTDGSLLMVELVAHKED